MNERFRNVASFSHQSTWKIMWPFMPVIWPLLHWYTRSPTCYLATLPKMIYYREYRLLARKANNFCLATDATIPSPIHDRAPGLGFYQRLSYSTMWSRCADFMIQVSLLLRRRVLSWIHWRWAPWCICRTAHNGAMNLTKTSTTSFIDLPFVTQYQIVLNLYP